MTFYNENDPYPATWLSNLIAAGHLSQGVVDRRSITEIRPEDINAHQAHFFAGIGGWDLALQLAGWPGGVPVWTGSCPCQPFSAAGRGGGFKDPRHLWPAWRPLINAHRPLILFGEQVAGKAGRQWFDLVSADLEAMGYTTWAHDLAAASVGAPHIRQRLYWVAYPSGERRQRLKLLLQRGRSQQALSEIGGGQPCCAWAGQPRQRGIGDRGKHRSKP